jgi:hypothetical protein
MDFDLLSIETAEKCFKDLKLQKAGQVNYQTFMSWSTGDSCLFDKEELEHLNRTAPPVKSVTERKQS